MAYARHSSNNRRGRNNRNGNRNNNGNRRPQARLNHVYDSNGPEGRVRGTAAQIVEKYTTLARDAGASGNKVLQQSFLQHAEHYQRILAEVQKEIEAQNERRAEQQKGQQGEKPANTDASEEDTAKDSTKAEDDKMTDVPGFLSDDSGEKEKSEKKPRGRKPKTVKIDIEEKKESLEAEPA